MTPVRAVSEVTLSAGDTSIVIVVLCIAVVALVFGFMFRREVLAASPGTESMREIGAAVQEGASAYLRRQFKTLGIFAVVAFFLLMALPGSQLLIYPVLWFLMPEDDSVVAAVNGARDQ